jgi:hypothetical protein
MPSPLDYARYEPTFAMTDSSELFFKNIRSVHYDFSEGPAEGISLYKLRGLEDSPVAVFIVLNWLRDRAYLMFEEREKALHLNIDAVDVELPVTRPEEGFRSAMTVCGAIRSGAALLAEDHSPLSPREARLMLRVCRDFLEIVDLF